VVGWYDGLVVFGLSNSLDHFNLPHAVGCKTPSISRHFWQFAAAGMAIWFIGHLNMPDTDTCMTPSMAASNMSISSGSLS
jgi:hypothetical protein